MGPITISTNYCSKSGLSLCPLHECLYRPPWHTMYVLWWSSFIRKKKYYPINMETRMLLEWMYGSLLIFKVYQMDFNVFQHFVCAKCEKPFHGHRHYEKKGLAYCEQHYHQLFGNLCYVCNQVIAGDGKIMST